MFHEHYLRVLKGFAEEVDEPAQRILVHGVNVGQIGDAEEKNGCMLGDGSIALSGLSDPDLCLLRNLERMQTVAS